MVDKVIETFQQTDPAEGETVIAENVSFEHFLKFFGEHHTEWLQGKVISVVSNNTQHQRLLGFLYKLLSLFLDFRPLGEVLLAGIPMKVGDQPAREPDLIFLLKANATRVKDTYIDGPADIAVEIISPESTERDRGKKFNEYEAAGVQEYWLFDPARQDCSIYALGQDGKYRRLPTDAEGRITSHLLPGFALHPDLLWREEPPNGAELIALVQGMVG